MSLKIGVVRESQAGENRVALDPASIVRFCKKHSARINLQKDAGLRSFFPDALYSDATIIEQTDELVSSSDIVVMVQAPDDDLLAALKPGQIIIGFMDPYRNKELVLKLQQQGITSVAMELVPRISRAQSMDALSSQASLAGYKCAIQAAQLTPGFFPMLTTAAGTIRPAKVLVIGAGVAGLQAIATAKRLGAMVEAYDIRPDAREQVESLGAKMIDTGVNAVGEGGYARALTQAEKQQQSSVLAEHLTQVNAVITTAAIPGREAPKIISSDMVANMQAGSVIVDMAAETGGNCEMTKAGENYQTPNGVTIAGPVNIPSTAPKHASEMYAKNILNLIELMLVDGELQPDWEDEVLAGACLTREGQVTHAGVKQAQDL
ncbi:MAG: Re/Si-specific NAD(P)(+) transhydrogenase subunit alpha [Gammaproteobacteria bacterium]|nr:Re/Si-specific NAD(P)(+) transhydrogenase subunit alpha [Gammaproteobacteria bacterium]NNC96752.1 Re/Si-specific NAD(P)(+) transhydrogenase subunit alpha [Gammaproteobacteria bacterium]NNM13518.1 Re/Si-specific NAD(P)(+) transhydrogenase subunit alpha [Gammaproteobacteria bacterium]